ncbi:hypothetical protein F4Z99_10900 [Candidatus Poribacteria bacterium]|nr:hypothetical protein [Candidatus Poribacteria bacterium]
MPTAVIAPNISRTQTGSFQFEISIQDADSLDRDSFSLANVQLNMQDGTVVENSDPEERDYTVAMGVVVRLSIAPGTAEGGSFTIRVTLSTEVSGTFLVDVTGQVMVGSELQNLTGVSKEISFDTLTSLGASFGKPSYRGEGVLAIPVNFAFDVIEPSRTIFELTHLSGAAIEDLDSYIVGLGREYELILNLPRASSGSFLLEASGTVFKTFSGTYDTVNLKPIFVPWSYLLAEIAVLGEPKEVSDGIFEVEVETDLPTKSLGVNSFSYKIPTESRVLFHSSDLEARPENPPLVSETDIASPACFESWERVEAGTAYPSSRFFLLRFNREYDDDTHIPEVLFLGGDLE